MGNLAADTAVEPVGEGRYRARLSADWEIWGPMGGYVAATALRAAGAAVPGTRPASFSCHYLGVAAFDEVELSVEPLRAGRAATSQRVRVTQGERSILDATVWSVSHAPGLEHDEARMPDVPPPVLLRTPAELVPDAPPPFPFWENFEQRPTQFSLEWPPPGPLPAEWRSWLRFLEWEPGADEWLEWPGSTCNLDHRPTIEAILGPCRLVELDGTITLTDIGPMVRYAASADGFYDDVIDRPWPAVTADLAAAAQRQIDRDGVLTVHAGCGLLVARVA